MIEDIKKLYYEDKPVFIMLAFYCIIFAGFFFLNTDCHRNIFYASLPFSAWLIYKNTNILKEFFQQHKSSVLLIAAYMLYMTLSIVWSDINEAGRGFEKAKILFLLPVSMTTLFLIVKKTPLAYLCLVYSFVAGAFFSAVYLIVYHVLYSNSVGYWDRLEGIGRAENSVMGAYLYGLAILAVLYARPIAALLWQYRLAIAGAAFIVMLFAMSRGPLLALAIACGGMMVFKKQYKRIIISGLLAMTVIIGICMAGMHDRLPILNRGDTGRPQVWTQAIEHMQDKPVFGHGIASKFIYKYGKNEERPQYASHPHSVYFGTMVQGGIVSLCLLLAIMVTVFLKSLQLQNRVGEGWPLAVFISFSTLGLYDFGGAYVNLGVVWLAFWFQYVLIMARENPSPVIE